MALLCCFFDNFMGMHRFIRTITSIDCTYTSLTVIGAIWLAGEEEDINASMASCHMKCYYRLSLRDSPPVVLERRLGETDENFAWRTYYANHRWDTNMSFTETPEPLRT